MAWCFSTRASVATVLGMHPFLSSCLWVNTLRPRQSCQIDIFKCIFLNENIQISSRVSLEFVPKGSINIIPALVQIMACRLVGAKPSSEPMVVSLLMHKFVTQPQWVKGEISLSHPNALWYRKPLAMSPPDWSVHIILNFWTPHQVSPQDLLAHQTPPHTRIMRSRAPFQLFIICIRHQCLKQYKISNLLGRWRNWAPELK